MKTGLVVVLASVSNLLLGVPLAGTLRGAETEVLLESRVGEADTFKVGARLFSDRDYVVAVAPETLRGMAFLRTSINGGSLLCAESGMLYALSPTANRAKAAHQDAALRAAGFEKLEMDEFPLFGGDAINRVSAYRKTVAKGERLMLGKWVLFLGTGLRCQKLVPKPWSENEGELLYNGIRLPKVWPPSHLDPNSREPMSVPYIESPPKVIPIDVGRQLLVDDFLIESTSMQREFHRARTYQGNPVLKPETALEMNGGRNPVACPFSDGVFCDPADQRFKMWYHAGWFDGTAYATSEDGIHWKRPALDVAAGTNRVIAPRQDFRRDGVSVWLDQQADRPEERFKMFLYARSGGTHPAGGRLLTSPDGIHFTERTLTGPLGDNTTFFYNPFRKKWVISIRSAQNGRQRSYWESDDFLAARDGRWTPQPPVYWCGADDLDKPDPEIQKRTQLYKVDAVGYESVMLGLMQIHYGPPNDVCAKGRFPKLTDLELAFSRDGFHWDRTCRETFIGASRRAGDWQRGYIHSAGGCCLIVGDQLYFYYGAFSGESPQGGGMYAGGATGLAFLRRDGFASMNAADTPATLTTRPVSFAGKHLFVNLEAPKGCLRAEVLDTAGNPIEPFTLELCEPLCDDGTLLAVRWQGAEDLSALAGKPVRFRFQMTSGRLYAFWVSPERSGASHGYVAAGGPGFTGPTDTVGSSGTKSLEE